MCHGGLSIYSNGNTNIQTEKFLSVDYVTADSYRRSVVSLNTCIPPQLATVLLNHCVAFLIRLFPFMEMAGHTLSLGLWKWLVIPLASVYGNGCSYP